VNLLWLWLSCASTLDTDAICKEVGFAIASRTEECGLGSDLAEARYIAFEEQYTCVEVDPADTAGVGGVSPEDLYHCPLAIRHLACELVEQYGDDLDLWLTASPTCRLLVESA
jgi:hypothetical protein